jgi:hypothetical protein
MRAIRKFSEHARKAISLEVPLDRIIALPCRADLGKLKFEETIDKDIGTVTAAMDKQFSGLGV